MQIKRGIGGLEEKGKNFKGSNKQIVSRKL
jgi:hypothetical protein